MCLKLAVPVVPGDDPDVPGVVPDVQEPAPDVQVPAPNVQEPTPDVPESVPDHVPEPVPDVTEDVLDPDVQGQQSNAQTNESEPGVPEQHLPGTSNGIGLVPFWDVLRLPVICDECQ